MGPSIYFTQGLRVSRLLDLEAVFGSISDTPTRAKNCECMLAKWEGKDKKNRDRRSDPEASENSRNIGMMEWWKNEKIRDQRSEVRDQRPEDQRTGKTAGVVSGYAVPRKTPVE
jgi:hypothetical protein